jgi:UDP-N-acetylglucosamine diphosphorylase/glucosamine-1-phosphate N-acetyltransferase
VKNPDFCRDFLVISPILFQSGWSVDYSHQNIHMKYVLFDDAFSRRLLPFTDTRPVADIRCGILTMRSRWELILHDATGTHTEDHIQPTFPATGDEDHFFVNGAVFADKGLVDAINALQRGQSLKRDGSIIAAHLAGPPPPLQEFQSLISDLPATEFGGNIRILKNVWDIFSLNDYAIRYDFELLTRGRKSAPIPGGVMVSGKEHLFIEDGALISAGSIINAATGPVYIGRDAEILEGAMVRGPLAMCDHSVIKMGAKIYGATTIGPGCKTGGEISNVVFFANSNKSHDGYLGNSVIGEWCNLGADTNSSNLKNNYDEVKIWSEQQGEYVSTGLIFCGLFMGDHSKCGINTMFNTGTVVGVSCNVFGAGFPEKFIPSFSWGNQDVIRYRFDRAMETANRMMARRGKQLTEQEVNMYKRIFERDTDSNSKHNLSTF